MWHHLSRLDTALQILSRIFESFHNDAFYLGNSPHNCYTTIVVKLKQKLNKILSVNTNQDIKKIELDTERDYFMSPKEAIKYGIIDKIVEKSI